MSIQPTAPQGPLVNAPDTQAPQPSVTPFTYRTLTPQPSQNAFSAIASKAAGSTANHSASTSTNSTQNRNTPKQARFRDIGAEINLAVKEQWPNGVPDSPLASAAMARIDFITQSDKDRSINDGLIEDPKITREQARKNYDTYATQHKLPSTADFEQAIRVYAMTPRGQEVLTRLTSTPNLRLLMTGDAQQRGGAASTGTQTMTIGKGVTSPLRFVAHEIGHTLVGGSNNDHANSKTGLNNGRNANVQTHENPLPQFLGLPDRQTYVDQIGNTGTHATKGRNSGSLPPMTTSYIKTAVEVDRSIFSD